MVTRGKKGRDGDVVDGGWGTVLGDEICVQLARRRRPLRLGVGRRRSRRGRPATDDASLTHTAAARHTRTHAQCHTVRAEQRYHHGEAAAPDRRDDPVLLWWRPRRCRSRHQQALRTHARQTEHRYVKATL